MAILRRTLLAACAVVAPLAAQAWDAAGHMLVGEIAWAQMTPAVRAQAAGLVEPLDTRFHQGRAYHFVTAGCWMDDMRGLGRDYPWSKLHYVTIPWTPSGAPAEIPPAPNIVTALDDTVRILRDRAAAPAQRSEALGMLIHFVGDIHQPLHATDRNGDRGGNAYLVSGVPFSDLLAKQGRNLHTFWDKAFRFDGQGPAIVETWQSPSLAERPMRPGEGIIAAQAKAIMTRFPREALRELGTAKNGAAWARESHVVGCLHAYPPGDVSAEVEVRVLTPAFAKKSQEIANRRIALAGYRLGDLLNSLLAR